VFISVTGTKSTELHLVDVGEQESSSRRTAIAMCKRWSRSMIALKVLIELVIGADISR
jgi:hypothetical protein